MESTAYAFPFVFMAGCALLLARQQTSHVAGAFLCLAGLVGTSAIGDGRGGTVGSICLLVSGFIICLPLGYFIHKKRRLKDEQDHAVACPKCGRQNGPEAKICPRCDTHFVSPV